MRKKPSGDEVQSSRTLPDGIGRSLKRSKSQTISTKLNELPKIAYTIHIMTPTYTLAEPIIIGPTLYSNEPIPTYKWAQSNMSMCQDQS